MEFDSLYLVMLMNISSSEPNPDSTFYYAQKLVEGSRAMGFKRLEHYGEMYKGNAMNFKGNLAKASESYLRAADIAEELGFMRGIGFAKTTLGGVYKRLGNQRLSLEYYGEALKITKEIGDTSTMAAVYLNIGYGYYSIDQLDSSKKYTEKAYEICIQTNHSALDYAKGNLALVNIKMGDLNARAGLDSVIQKLKEVGDSFAVSDYLSQLSSILISQGKIKEAINAGEESLEISMSLGLKEQIMDASKFLSELYEMKNDFEKSLSYYHQYVDYKDSITNTQAINEMADLRTDFEVSQKQAEVDILNIQKRNQQYVLLGAALFSVMLLVLAAVIFRSSREKNRINLVLESQKKDLEDLNQTKDRFFSIISHDLRGPVNAFHGVSRMIKFMVQNKQMEELEELAEDIDQSVNRLSNLLDNLLNWAVQQQGNFPYSPEKLNVFDIIEDLKGVFKTMALGKQITIESNVSEDLNIIADRNMTLTIVRNLFSNALKFTPEEGKVSVQATQAGELIELTISDTGVGIPDSKLEDIFKLQAQKSTWGTEGEKGLGLGLQLVQEFIELNKGTVKVQSQEGAGTTFVVNLPAFR